MLDHLEAGDQVERAVVVREPGDVRPLEREPPAGARPSRLNHGRRGTDAHHAHGAGGREHLGAYPCRIPRRAPAGPARAPGPLVAREVLGREQLIAHRLRDEPLGNVRG